MEPKRVPLFTVIFFLFFFETQNYEIDGYSAAPEKFNIVFNTLKSSH